MKTQLLAVSAAIHEFYIQHPGALEAKKKHTLLSREYWIKAKSSTSDQFIRDASSLVRRICEYLAAEEANILRNRQQLTRSQTLYIDTLQGFRDLHQRLRDRNNCISVCRFIDQLTILEIEIKMAVATFDAEVSSAHRSSISQPNSRRNTAALTFSANETNDPSSALTIYDPSTESTLERKVSWKENIEEHHHIQINAKRCCFLI